ncbi:hypothetical protein BaRGS_00015930 [Batillaria attramentaria]|uniref:Ankyrin repeat domain-containing protein 40 n=1 Tax=Batillaria attramentaria TaxID=370345 RepID=A0ABD0L164_9CAEN
MEQIEERELEENLREAASTGNMDLLRNLVEMKSVNVNSKNHMNGRTALHWGAKRNHIAVVQYLLDKGADGSAVDNEGKTAVQLTSNSKIHALLGGSGDIEVAENSLPITPNYLANPPFPYSSSNQPATSPVTNGDSVSENHSIMMNSNVNSSPDDELVLKARLANSDDPDFIEVELPRSSLRYDSLLNLLCAELAVDKQLVSRIRKLPDTIIRKDKDVTRLKDFQELELVLTNKAMSALSRGYRGIGTNPTMASEQILY